MKNTIKLMLAAALFAVAVVACNKPAETTENKDSVATEQPAIDTTATQADSTSTAADSTAAQ